MRNLCVRHAALWGLAFLMLFWGGCDHTPDAVLTEGAAFESAPRVRTTSTESEAWNYSDRGPALWPELFPDACAGSSQSPIDIVPGAVVRKEGLPSLHFEYDRAVTLDVFNNSRTVEAAIVEGEGILKVGEEAYELDQFHFHTPSEHRIDGREAPIEMHLVHRNEHGERTVVGVLIVAGPAHRELQKIWQDLPTVEDTVHVAVHPFDLLALLPAAEGTYRYSGSLTTPTCAEGVNWIVMREPIRMSRRQIAALQAIFSGDAFPDGNRRPPQPLNGRLVEGQQ